MPTPYGQITSREQWNQPPAEEPKVEEVVEDSTKEEENK